ncbi:AraC family transcriptional regulator [Sphingobacterium griseoflavum]|uniref:HTH araC/xylS-type domain-containing protein n=1 Tax=Sphingobacterium griseoflavum TaxID=1474952 RepID=A0ABQ3HSA6_9SPHI|nr:AraC family transcriptional regulator [Sphingobacterium griseoflavum]GHE29735.1 hypothetical protein GCM10017764_10910 [Sphingobacterium griseoflavum]
MCHAKYLQFAPFYLGEEEVRNTGYLGFLPAAYHQGMMADLCCSCCELEHILLLEIYGEVPAGGCSFKLLPHDFLFWQCYQLMGQSKLSLSENFVLAENRCLPFVSNKRRISMAMDEGKVRIIYVGYKEPILEALFQEYPATGNLLLHRAETPPQDLLLPDVGINFRFREVFRQLSSLQFRAFHTRSELTLCLGRLFQELDTALQRESDSGGRSMLQVYHRAIQYIREHYKEDMSKESIADALAISRRTLYRAFERKHIKIADFIQQLKLRKAQELLHQGEMSVEEVANELQFPNRKYFSREFKKYFFEPPSSIKRNTK